MRWMVKVMLSAALSRAYMFTFFMNCKAQGASERTSLMIDALCGDYSFFSTSQSPPQALGKLINLHPALNLVCPVLILGPVTESE